MEVLLRPRKATPEELVGMLEGLGDYLELAVDVRRQVRAAGGEYHMDWCGPQPPPELADMRGAWGRVFKIHDSPVRGAWARVPKTHDCPVRKRSGETGAWGRVFKIHDSPVRGAWARVPKTHDCPVRKRSGETGVV